MMRVTVSNTASGPISPPEHKNLSSSQQLDLDVSKTKHYTTIYSSKKRSKERKLQRVQVSSNDEEMKINMLLEELISVKQLNSRELKTLLVFLAGIKTMGGQTLVLKNQRTACFSTIATNLIQVVSSRLGRETSRAVALQDQS